MRILNQIFLLLILSISLIACGGSNSQTALSQTSVVDANSTAALSDADWRLVWSDEFNGSNLDSSLWSHDLGTGSSQGLTGWGNNELQYYRAENTSVANGYLTIEAKQESFGGSNYTSSRINTKNKRTVQYGRIEFRAKLPQGQGMWPAFWMLGSNIDTVSWPSSGEIDVMEMVGGSGRENKILGTVHWQNGSSYSFLGSSKTLSSGTFADAFHVFSVVWDSSSIKWYVDGEHYFTFSLTDSLRSEFLQPFYLLINLAVGGNLPQSPDSTTVFPQQLIVDYVRIYEAQ